LSIKTGVKGLDRLLDGGLEEGVVTEVYGDGGSGKTSFALMVAVRAAESGSKVHYIDCEGVSPARLRQIAGDGHKKTARRILFFEPNSMEELEDHLARSIKLAKKDKEVGLIVLDTLVTFYRQAIGTRDESSTRSLVTNFVVRLHRLARDKGIPVLVTNQVYFDPETGTMVPLGGQGIGHIAKTILRIDRLAPGRRRMVLMKHRHRREGERVDLVLTDKGLEEA
jgi:DNA repair protein RadB